jgi:hypothetical protein
VRRQSEFSRVQRVFSEISYEPISRSHKRSRCLDARSRSGVSVFQAIPTFSQGFVFARYRFIEYFLHIRHCEGCSCAVPWCGDSIRTFLYCIASSSSRGIPATDRVILCAYEIELFIDVCTRVAKCPLVNSPALRRSSNCRRVGRRLRSVRCDRAGCTIAMILTITR